MSVPGKVTEDGLRTSAAEPVPVPVRVTVSSPPTTLPAMLSVPEREPVLVGSKATCTVQLPWGGMACPEQSSCSVKFADAETVERFRLSEPLLVTVTVCAALTVSTARLEKVSEEGETVALAKVDPALARPA